MQSVNGVKFLNATSLPLLFAFSTGGATGANCYSPFNKYLCITIIT